VSTPNALQEPETVKLGPTSYQYWRSLDQWTSPGRGVIRWERKAMLDEVLRLRAILDVADANAVQLQRVAFYEGVRYCEAWSVAIGHVHPTPPVPQIQHQQSTRYPDA
jgi:hypothetical protein